MDDQLSEILKSLKAAEDILQAGSVKGSHPEPKPEPKQAPDEQSKERRISLGDVAKATHDYEREPFDRK